MLSKAELARRAGLSALTIDRVESGRPCRLDTKRRILAALGLDVADHPSIFGSSLSLSSVATSATSSVQSDAFPHSVQNGSQENQASRVGRSQ